MDDDLFAYARRTDPTTSHAAADFIEPFLGKIEKAVADAVYNAGPHGANWFEVTLATEIDKATVSPRFKPLCKKGILKAKRDLEGEVVTRPGFSKKGQIVWVSTKFG